jgi:hypothetical protein
VISLDSELNNGGFDQYFTDSAGDGAHRLLDAPMAIEAFETAGIVQRAPHRLRQRGTAREPQRALGPDRWTNDDVRLLDDCDRAYCARRENRALLISHYARAHRNEFMPSPAP